MVRWWGAGALPGFGRGGFRGHLARRDELSTILHRLASADMCPGGMGPAIVTGIGTCRADRVFVSDMVRQWKRRGVNLLVGSCGAAWWYRAVSPSQTLCDPSVPSAAKQSSAHRVTLSLHRASRRRNSLGVTQCNFVPASLPRLRRDRLRSAEERCGLCDAGF